SLEFAQSVRRRPGKGLRQHLGPGAGVETRSPLLPVRGQGLPVRVQFLGVASHRHHRKGEVLVPVGVGRGVGGRVVRRTTDLAPLHEADITRGEQVLQSFITFRTLASNTKKHRPWPVWKRPTGPCSARPRSVPPPPSKKNR